MFQEIKNWHIAVALLLMICGAAFTIGNFLYAFDKKKVDKVEFIILASQVQAGFAEQTRDAIQKNIWDIENRFQCGPRYGNSCYTVIKDHTIKNSYTRLEKELKKITEKLKRIYKGG